MEVDLIVRFCWEHLQVKFLWVYVCISRQKMCEWWVYLVLCRTTHSCRSWDAHGMLVFLSSWAWWGLGCLCFYGGCVNPIFKKTWTLTILKKLDPIFIYFLNTCPTWVCTWIPTCHVLFLVCATFSKLNKLFFCEIRYLVCFRHFAKKPFGKGIFCLKFPCFLGKKFTSKRYLIC